MKKYILKISKTALFVILATSLVSTSQTHCADPKESFISQEINLVDKAVDSVVKLFEKLFRTDIKFRDAVTLLSRLVTETQSKIVVPMERQLTRSSDGEIGNARALVSTSFAMLCDIEQKMKSLLGCKNPNTFRSGLESIESGLSSQFADLTRDLNRFYQTSKKSNTAYAKDIGKLLQTIRNSEKTKVSKIIMFNRIHQFAREA